MSANSVESVYNFEMSHNQSKNTAKRKAASLENDCILDRSDILNNNNTRIIHVPKKKAHISRMSTMPSTSTENDSTDLKITQFGNNVDLELYYKQYIASHAAFLLQKIKLKEAEELYIKTVKTYHKETKILLETYMLLKTRLKDIQIFSEAHDFMNAIPKKVTEFKEKLDECGIENTLSHLEKALIRFNILQSQNITLPSIPDGVNEFKKGLKECYNEIQNNRGHMTIALIVIEKMTKNIDEFVTMYNEFSNAKETVEDRICNLQIEILKTCSNLLSQCNEAD